MTKYVVLWGAGLLSLGVGLGIFGTLWLRSRNANASTAAALAAESAAQAKSAAEAQGVPTNEPAADHETVLALPADVVERAGITTQALAGTSHDAEVAALGQLELDPSAMFVLRAPAAGRLAAAQAGSWPGLGAKVENQVPIGMLVPRLSPIERADLEQRALVAELDVATASAAVAAAEANLQRARALNAKDKNVSDRELEAAMVTATTESAKLSMARAASTQLADLLGKAPAGLPLACPGSGQVVEVLAQLGENVEAGQPLLRAADPTRLVARLQPPLGQPFDAAATIVRLILPTWPPSVTKGELVGSGAADGLLYRFAMVEGAAESLRPGLPVTAWLPKVKWVDVRGGNGMRQPQPGLLVPSDAVVRYRGQALVFVRRPAASDAVSVRFALCPIATDVPMPGGFFVPASAQLRRPTAQPSLQLGDEVVVGGAGALLSQLLRHEIPATDEASAEGK